MLRAVDGSRVLNGREVLDELDAHLIGHLADHVRPRKLYVYVDQVVVGEPLRYRGFYPVGHDGPLVGVLYDPKANSYEGGIVAEDVPPVPLDIIDTRKEAQQ